MGGAPQAQHDGGGFQRHEVRHGLRRQTGHVVAALTLRERGCLGVGMALDAVSFR